MRDKRDNRSADRTDRDGKRAPHARKRDADRKARRTFKHATQGRGR